MRAIDADAYIEYVQRVFFDAVDADTTVYGVHLSMFILTGLINDLKNENITPTIEPERMRGRWQEITASDCSGYDPVLAGYDDPVVGYVCSVCHEGYEKEVMGKTTWDFCPNCGADMRGRTDEPDDIFE